MPQASKLQTALHAQKGSMSNCTAIEPQTSKPSTLQTPDPMRHTLFLHTAVLVWACCNFSCWQAQGSTFVHTHKVYSQSTVPGCTCSAFCRGFIS